MPRLRRPRPSEPTSLPPVFAWSAQVDVALASFTEEMKAQGLWDGMAVVTISDFARTMTDNGQGTDHAWGGNHVVMGGVVKGGQVHARTVL